MNWYKGDIAQAVDESRRKNAIFVVFITGNDAASGKLLNMIEERTIRAQLESEQFVTIRIESDSMSYIQFASIYQVAPVPSIFFIGRTGIPIEIGTSVMKTADELRQKITRVLQAQSIVSDLPSTSMASSSASALTGTENKTVTADQATNTEPEPEIATVSFTVDIFEEDASSEIIYNDKVCFEVSTEAINTKKQTEVKAENKDDDTVTISVASLADIKQTQRADSETSLTTTSEQNDQDHSENLPEENTQETEHELLLKMQQWQREKALKDFKNNIRRERAEDHEVRERIRAQIASDRVERAKRLETAGGEPAVTNKTTTNQKPKVAAGVTNAVRLQFRFPNGDIKARAFEMHDTIATVRSFVSSELLLSNTGTKDFALTTVYPRHEFSAEEELKTLVSLDLFPSAVIFVIPRESVKPTAVLNSRESIVSILSSFIAAVMSPFFSVLKYLRVLLFNRRINVNNESANSTTADQTTPTSNNENSQEQADVDIRSKLDHFMTGPSTSHQLTDIRNGQKLYSCGTSNIYRLSDKRKDADDENATWNGNSTQQQ